MKKLISKLSIFLALALAAAAAPTMAAKSKSKNVVATCVDGNITEDKVLKFGEKMLMSNPELKDKKFSELEPNLQKGLIDGYITEKLITKEAKKTKIHTTKEFKEKVENFSKQLMIREFMEKIVKSKVTDAMVDKEYQKLVDSLKNKKEVKAAHILVDDEKTAKELRRKITKGKDFGEVARTHSKDTGSKLAGGEIGYFLQEQMVPEFAKKAFSMKSGEVSSPVKTQFGWHIIKVMDKRPARVPSKQEAKQGLFNQLAATEVQKYIEELKKSNKVKLNIEEKKEHKKSPSKKS